MTRVILVFLVGVSAMTHFMILAAQAVQLNPAILAQTSWKMS